MIESILSVIVSIAPFVALVAVYFLLLKAPEETHKPSIIKELHIGDKVITTGGIVGYIAKINIATVILENYDGSLIEVHHSAIAKKST